MLVHAGASWASRRLHTSIGDGKGWTISRRNFKIRAGSGIVFESTTHYSQLAHEQRPNPSCAAGPHASGRAHPRLRELSSRSRSSATTTCARRHGFDPDWIVNRTGIHERRFALPHQATSDLCVHAATRCLKAAGRDPADVDLLVVATFTPDMAFPSTANLIQDRLKLACPAFDVQAACAGFVFALVIAAQFVATGNSQCARHRRRLQQPGDQSRRSEELSTFRRRCRRGLARSGRKGPGPGRLPARLRRLRRRPPQPARPAAAESRRRRPCSRRASIT